MTRPLLVLFVAMLLALGGCGSEQGSSEKVEPVSPGPITNSEELGSAPEPDESPPAEEEPEGEVIDIGDSPEGIVADPETGLVAVGLREPPRLLLVDSSNGEEVETVDLPGSPRHLRTVAPGGPVLVPGEGAAAIVQVSLPDGDVISETSVERVPHDADATAGRIFVGNEFSDTMSVIEDDSVVETIDVPFMPGGVAATDDELVGVVGVAGLGLEVFDATTLDSLGLVAAGEGPTHIEAGPDNRFYVADTRGDAILIYDIRPEPEQIDSYDLPGGAPYGTSMDPERNQLWVALSGTNEVVQFVLEDGSLRELARYPTVSQPNSVAVDTSTGRVFVTGSTGGELQFFDPAEA